MESNKSFDRKINLEDLSKEELVTKCKTLLSIIQKAKQSKGLMQEEIEKLKAKLDSEIKKKEVNPVVEELIQDLTQQKLNLVSNIEDLKLKNEASTTSLNQYKEEKKRAEIELNKLDNENIALKRQITRLTDDNEQLISHLESLEKQIEQLNQIGLDQQKQLLKLEENNVLHSNSSTKDSEKIQELEKMLSISLDEIKRMKSEKDKSMNEETDTYNLNIKFKEKLRSYHSKIIKLAVNIKVLKNDKEAILNQFRTYIDQVRDWKDKLHIASNNLLKTLNQLEGENDKLKTDNLRLKELNKQYMEQLEAHKTDDEKGKELEEIKFLEMRNSTLVNEISEMKKEKLEEKGSLDQIQTENENLKKKIEKLMVENSSNMEMCKQEMLVFEMKMNKLNEENEELQKKLSKETENLLANSKKTGELNERIEYLLEQIEKCNKEKTLLDEEFSKLSETSGKQELNIEELKQENKKLVNELEKSLATEKQLAEKSGEEMLKLVKEIESLTSDTTKLQEQIEEYERKEDKIRCRILVNADIQTENDFMAQPELEEEVQLLKSENSQLLTEMNEMNQELKERGENLSKLEAHCKEIKKKLKIYETQANTNVNSITQKEESIKELNERMSEKDETISNLKNEIEALKEKVNCNFDNSSCEVDLMSTSTISRTEEIDRLRDLEGSWEEKYGKLKSLAIKLKAKLREQVTEVNNEKTEKADLQQKLNSAYDNLKIVQSQFDDTNDEMDEIKKKYQEYSKKVANNEEIIQKRETKISEMQSEIKTLKEEKTATETWKKQISVKVQALRKELEAKEAAKLECEKKLSTLKSEYEAKDKALKAEIESHKKTKNSLQHFTNENKKQTVLNLEMQDFEKSVKDLSAKLEKKTEQIAKLKEQIDAQKVSTSALTDQKNCLEEKILVYESNLETLVTEKNAYAKKLSEVEIALQNKEEIISNLYQQLETVRSQNEELSTTLSNDIAERQKIINSLRDEKENLYLQSMNVQQNNRELQQKLSLKEDELSTVNTEFDNYKIRAQSVLRQNQNRDIGLEEKLNGNVCSLLSQIEVLNSEMNEVRNSNGNLENINEALKLEHSTLKTKYEEISNNMKDIKEQYEKLQLKHTQAINEHKDTVRSLKVHAETLSQCYRQQISEQEVRHNREIIELQSRIEKSQTPAEVTLPLPSMTREEGEGSESIDSVNNLPVPLEKLLSEEDEVKQNILKKQISEQESKLTHLTELLADTEQDLAKHIQMNKVLKEEIRRQQRAVEREKHAENLEYLKNVVFKFVTLHNGDERSRLVPVLNTILKLSPEEAKKLDMVAKGDPGLKGWSSYLPVWNSSNKS